jgi:hypothetical protein
VRFLSLLLALYIPAAAQVAPMLNLVVVEGEGAVNNIRQRTAREPIVQVQDENHKPVAGAIVVFTLPTNGAGGAFANGAHTLTIVTDSEGKAVARGLKPNGIKGQYQIRVNASSKGQTASTNITQINAVIAASGAAAGAAVSGKLIAILVAVGAAAAGGAAYAIHANSGGAPAAITPVATATTIAIGTGAVGPPR